MNRPEALMRAKYLWEVSAHIQFRDKLMYCKQLAELDVFSISQVAKIGRIDPKSLRKRGIKSRAPGGLFDAEAVSTLLLLEEQVRLGEQVSKPLIRLCVGAGCSLSVVARIIGMQVTKIYRFMEET